MTVLSLLLALFAVSPADTNAVRASAPPVVVCAADAACVLEATSVQGALDVDGRLDEADWARTAVATGFRQAEPREGAAASFDTEVRVLYGADALYVGARLHDADPAAIIPALGRRDAFNQADWFMVAVDSYFDRKTAYTFAVNAAGVQVDGLLTDEMDESWDAVWSSAVAIGPDGWTAELRIPYAMLRFAEAPVQTWGINFRRIIPRLSETSEWSLITRAEAQSGRVAGFGELHGLRSITPRRNVQIAPYTVSGVRTDEGADGRLSADATVDVGGDLKIGLTPSITLDATLNPDFGQVESDPAQLNLTAFETFFPERRPFFVEGVQIFDFNFSFDGALLYTRRIGANEPIIAASKVSGRTARGLSFGVLSAATGADFDPARYYGVARVQQELGRLSTAGGMATAYRHAPTGRTALAGGVDWNLRFLDNRYGVEGQTSFTRRDAPGEDARTGGSAILSIDRLRGTWRPFLGVRAFSAAFDPGEVGRLRRDNFVRLMAGFGYEVNGGRPFGPVQRADTRLFTWQSWTFDEGIDQGGGFFLFGNATLRSFQSIGFRMEVDRIFGGYDVYETRGGGPWARPRSVNGNLSVETDSRRSWSLEPSLGLDVTGGGRGVRTGLEAEWNASDRLNLSVEVGAGREDAMPAWASNESFRLDGGAWTVGAVSNDRAPSERRAFDDGGVLPALLASLDAGDDGAFYVPIVGDRDTRSFDLSLRGGMTFTPNLSLQLYTQLFTARGRYDGFGLLVDPETRLDFPAYPKRRAFSYSSLLANAVLRWEYRPGSSLYVVWSQARGVDEAVDALDPLAPSPYDRGTRGHLADTFELFPANVFMVKLSYLFLR